MRSLFLFTLFIRKICRDMRYVAIAIEISACAC